MLILMFTVKDLIFIFKGYRDVDIAVCECVLLLKIAFSVVDKLT